MRIHSTAHSSRSKASERDPEHDSQKGQLPLETCSPHPSIRPKAGGEGRRQQKARQVLVQQASFARGPRDAGLTPRRGRGAEAVGIFRSVHRYPTHRSGLCSGVGRHACVSRVPAWRTSALMKTPPKWKHGGALGSSDKG